MFLGVLKDLMEASEQVASGCEVKLNFERLVALTSTVILPLRVKTSCSPDTQCWKSTSSIH